MTSISESSGHSDITLFPAQTLFAPILSIIATIAVLVLCLLQRSYKDFLGKMILLLNLSDLLFCSAKVLGSYFIPSTDLGCKLFQMFANAGLVSSVVLTALFGHILWIVSGSRDADLAKRRFKYYISIGVIFPSLMAIASVFTDFIIKESDGTKTICVHRSFSESIDFTGLIFTIIPVLSFLILSIIWYFLAALKLKNLLEEGTVHNLIILIIYPAILWICWGPYIIMSFLIMSGHQVSSGVMIVCRALDQLQGFFDAIVFWPGTRKIIRALCKRICVCNKNRHSSAILEDSNEEEFVLETESLKNSLIKRQRIRTMGAESHSLNSTRISKSSTIYFNALMPHPHSLN